MDEDLKKVREMLSNSCTRLEGNEFSVIRERDGEGGIGEMYPLDRHAWKKSGELGEIIVGLSITVGFYGWTTTPVTEIMDVSEDRKKAKIRTMNSVYLIEAVESDQK